MKERLSELERLSRPLETAASQRLSALNRAGDHSDEYLSKLQSISVYMSSPDRVDALADMALSATPGRLDDALSVLTKHVDGIGHNLGSSRFFAYIPSGSLHEAAIGDYLAAVSNRYAGVGFASPGATRMDETLIRWLAGLVGYPDTCEGDLTSGGSMATLSAVVTAREDRGLKSADISRAVVYCTSQTHHTFNKALNIAGLGECLVREIKVDAQQRMDVHELRGQVERDQGSDLVPWLVIGTAGTTNFGAIDPLNEIADVAQQFGLWYHIDAAYGGAFAVCEAGRQRLAGIERSDSLILDPHKGFFIPCGTGVLLVREGRKLYNAFAARGVYMQDVEDTERSPCDLSPELTRPFRALRFWLPLKIHGTAVFEAALEEKLLLAQYFYEQLQSLSHVEIVGVPDLSIVAFRFVPPQMDADAFNQRLVEDIARDGRVFLTSTLLNGRYVIRMAILNYQSHKAEVDLALQVIQELVQARLK